MDGAKVAALFSKYKDEGDDTISIQGVLAMATDLGMEMTDLRVTILLAFMNFVKLSSSKVDFTKGMTEMGCVAPRAVEDGRQLARAAAAAVPTRWRA